MFSITFKLSESVSTEKKRDFNIDAILEDNDKTFEDIKEYNQYVSLLENIKEKNEVIELDNRSYVIESIRTVTKANLSEIKLVVTLEEPSPYINIDWGQINKGNNNWYTHTYIDDSSNPYNIKFGTGTTVTNGDPNQFNDTTNFTGYVNTLLNQKQDEV